MARSWVHLHWPKLKRGDKACLSVKVGTEPVRYEASMMLADVKFVVRPAGRRATLTTGRKNVHAWVTGVQRQVPNTWGWREARYNPFECDSFVDKETGAPLFEAAFALIQGQRVLYLPKELYA